MCSNARHFLDVRVRVRSVDPHELQLVQYHTQPDQLHARKKPTCLVHVYYVYIQVLEY